jgi:hypothetical protein
MRVDFSVDCDSEQYARVWYYAAVMVLVYPLGVPLLYWCMLWLQAACNGRCATLGPFQHALTAPPPSHVQ